MSVKSLFAAGLAVACALATWSCEGMSPASPSTLTSSRGVALRPFDEAPAPAPAPGTPAPAPDPAPAPVTTTINIIGTDGATAFLPNPIQAAMGNLLVWMNGDTRLHHIVLDDGTDIGDVLPGQATAPKALATGAPTGFHCTIHPSMVGMINGELPAPAPAPPYEPPYGPPSPYDPYDPYY
jgi:plastocyanin